MAFDFGAALSSIGQLAPAQIEGAEIRRQRLADAEAVKQRSVAAADEHAARQAQTAREQQLTALDSRNANRFIPISSKPERGEDGKYYMLFMAPDNKIQRLPVDGNYDPNAEKKALLKELNVPEDSELGRQVLLNVKPETYGTTVDLDPKSPTYGQLVYYSKRPGGEATATPVTGPSGKAIGGRTPATSTTSTSDYHWVDSQGNVHATPTTRTTTRRYGVGAQPTPTSSVGAPQTNRPLPARPSPSTTPPNGSKGDRIIGTGKLPAAAEKIVITTQPVIDQTDRLIKRIDDLGLANNNDRAYLAKDYLNYKLGKAAPAGELGNDIAGLSLGSVVDAGSALAGSSRSLQALKLAMVHTPNPWIDSPKLLREKLITINSRLKDMVGEAKSAGQGTGQPSSTNWESTATSADGKTKIGYRDGKWFNISTGQEYK